MMTIPFSDALAQAFGWTLVHSLWQATLIALLLLLVLPRLQSAQKRYWAAYGSLLGVLVIAVITFFWMYQQPGTVAPSEYAQEPNGLAVNYLPSGFITETNIFAAVPAWLEAHYPLMVTLWLLGFSLFLFRLAGGLWYVNRLRHEGLFHVEHHWQERINQLGQQLSQSRPVTLFQSALVHTPVAIGYLKPIVLLPIGFINRLSPAEVEAVLTHELAHIARRDWLFNLLQAFIESLFYFHPAVWWMSGIIRSERENCCDDAAIALSGNPLYYAKALLRVQELAKAAPVTRLALGLDGSITSSARRRMYLLERVRRILNQPQHKSHNMEKFVATAVLLVLLILVGLRANTPPVLEAAFAQISELTPDFLKSQTDEYSIQGDSLKPKGKRKIVQEDDDRRVEVEYQDGQVTRLNIDGKEIPTADFPQHQDLTETILRESVPPAPPAPPMAPYPPAAPLPPGTTNWATPPAPPMPPTPPTPPRIRTTKGQDGSILLHIENDDNPVEIRVKDGETWVDGRKLAEGEALDLPGLSKGEGNSFGYNFSWGGADGNFFPISPDQEFHFEGLEALEGLEHFEFPADARKRIDEAREELQALEENRRELDRSHREMEKDLKRQQKEFKQQRKEMERSQKEAAEQYQIAMQDHQRAMEEARTAQARAKSEQRMADQNVAFWRDRLKQDGIITGSKDYSMLLSTKKLVVNGKQQSEELHRKYLDLYSQRGGHPLGKDGSFMINWNSDEE